MLLTVQRATESMMQLGQSSLALTWHFIARQDDMAAYKNIAPYVPCILKNVYSCTTEEREGGKGGACVTTAMSHDTEDLGPNVLKKARETMRYNA